MWKGDPEKENKDWQEDGGDSTGQNWDGSLADLGRMQR